MPQVKVIQPIAEQAKKLRVAAYARVSSDSADQLNSFATQVDYYTNYLNVRNNGQLSKFYIKNSHPVIIPVEVFETVRALIESRAAFHQPTSVAGSFPLSGILKCSICGFGFHRHLKKDIARWNCSQHAKNASLCPMKAVTEKEVYRMFLKVYNKLLDNQDILKAMLNQLLQLQTKSAFARPDIVEINEKISELIKQNHSLTRLQTKGCIDSAIFIERSNRNNQKIEELRRELLQLQEPDQISSIIDHTKLLLDLMEEASPMLEFEPSIFKSMVQRIIVYPERFSFHLINGLVLDEGRYQG